MDSMDKSVLLVSVKRMVPIIVLKHETLSVFTTTNSTESLIDSFLLSY
jgi:hypothetical protein